MDAGRAQLTITIDAERLWDVLVNTDEDMLPFATFERLATVLGADPIVSESNPLSLTKGQYLSFVKRLLHPLPTSDPFFASGSKTSSLPSSKRTDFDLFTLLPEGSPAPAPVPASAPAPAPSDGRPAFTPSQKRLPSQSPPLSQPLQGLPHPQPQPKSQPQPQQQLRPQLRPRHPPCICGDEVERRLPDTVRLRCRCVLHAQCLGNYFLQLLGDAHTQVGPHGVRCPYFHTCKTYISTDDAEKFHEFLANNGWDKQRRPSTSGNGGSVEPDLLLPLQDASGPPLAPAPGSVPFDGEALTKLSQFSVAATFASNELVYCPACNVPFFVDDAFRKGAVKRATCECGCTFCWRCLIPWARHRAFSSCEAYQRAANALDEDTARYISATSKPCPGCAAPLTHYHGHSCHHISAVVDDKLGGGCPRCHTHYCYACLATAAENERERGARQACRCKVGRWGTFCQTAAIVEHLVEEPYPHDSRCGCPICPDCRPGVPCGGATVTASGGVRTGDAGCDGSCVVCLGLVPPGPAELRKPAAAVAADLLDYTSL